MRFLTGLLGSLANIVSRNSMLTLQAIQISRPTSTPHRYRAFLPPSTVVARRQHYVLGIDSLLRKLGVYGRFIVEDKQGIWNLRVCIGYRPPFWLITLAPWSLSLNAELSNISSLTGELGISITSGYVKVQNRVPIDSPFMVACRTGDIQLMRQSLRKGHGYVSDRSMCTGKTPLLVSLSTLEYIDISE